ncbi:unnamed protein product [Camellia sinensis]
MKMLSVLTRNLRLEGAFDLLKIARSTPGFVGADLAALANKAGNFATKRIIDRRKSEQSREPIDEDHIEDWWSLPWLPEEMENLSITMADFEVSGDRTLLSMQNFNSILNEYCLHGILLIRIVINLGFYHCLFWMHACTHLSLVILSLFVLHTYLYSYITSDFVMLVLHMCMYSYNVIYEYGRSSSLLARSVVWGRHYGSMFPLIYAIAANGEELVALVRVKQGEAVVWNVRLRCDVQDWELDQLVDLLGFLYGLQIGRDGMDSLVWDVRGSRGVFLVSSFYGALAGGLVVCFLGNVFGQQVALPRLLSLFG